MASTRGRVLDWCLIGPSPIDWLPIRANVKDQRQTKRIDLEALPNTREIIKRGRWCNNKALFRQILFGQFGNILQRLLARQCAAQRREISTQTLQQATPVFFAHTLIFSVNLIMPWPKSTPWLPCYWGPKILLGDQTAWVFYSFEGVWNFKKPFADIDWPNSSAMG